MDSARLLLLTFLSPAIFRAADSCPWLNSATASGVLGVSVEGGVTQKGNVTECVFLDSKASPATTLRVEIETGSHSKHPLQDLQTRCRSTPIPLTTIGNEAVACSAQNTGSRTDELVFGRVRDQVFTIEIQTDEQRVTREKLRSEVRKLAEHVAGNLF